ncbi:MAG: hypothetical protein AAF658_19935, partial [Myxococcota bacterium]
AATAALLRESWADTCSVGLSHGSVVLQSGESPPRAGGLALSKALGMAFRAGPGRILVDGHIHSVSESGFVYRSVAEDIFELDRDQPQWIDRWEEAALVTDSEFVGRHETFEAFATASEDATCTVVSVRGRVGIGRRAFSLEALRRADCPPDRIFEAQPHAFAPEPYWPILGITRQLLRIGEDQVERDTLLECLERLDPSGALRPLENTLSTLLSVERVEGSDFDELDPVEVRSSIASTVTSLLERVAGEGAPLALIFHEAHRLDPPSMQTISRIVELYQGEARLFVVLMHKGHLRVSLPRTDIALPPLEHASTRTIASRMLDTVSLPDDLWEFLRQRAKGSPLMLANLIRLLVETGDLLREDGEWRLSQGFSPAGVPRQLKRILERRIAHLPVKLASLLQSCATFGESVTRRSIELIWVSRGF